MMSVCKSPVFLTELSDSAHMLPPVYLFRNMFSINTNGTFIGQYLKWSHTCCPEIEESYFPLRSKFEESRYDAHFSSLKILLTPIILTQFLGYLVTVIYLQSTLQIISHFSNRSARSLDMGTDPTPFGAPNLPLLIWPICYYSIDVININYDFSWNGKKVINVNNS